MGYRNFNFLPQLKEKKKIKYQIITKLYYICNLVLSKCIKKMKIDS